MEQINALVKKIVINLALACLAFMLIIGCSNKEGANSNSTQDLHTYPDVAASDAAQDSTEDTTDLDTITEVEDTYSIWTDPCVECAWYFCDSLDVIYQKQICINNCNDPPTVVYEGICEEHLECNPAQKLLEANIPCITPDGFPGTKEKICNKGQIQYTNCVSECSEEVCDKIDNDCDGEIDEGVLNDCGECEIPLKRFVILLITTVMVISTREWPTHVEAAEKNQKKSVTV